MLSRPFFCLVVVASLGIVLPGAASGFLQTQNPGQEQPSRQRQGAPAAMGVQTEPVRPEDQCVVEGMVYATTGEPLRKARVMLIPMNRGGMQQGPNAPYSGVTDAGGRFRITSIDPGRYNVMVERSGYVQEGFGGQTIPGSSPRVLDLAAKQEIKDLSFKLQRGAVVTGRVVDEDGEPLSRVQVQVVRTMYRQGRRELAPVGFGQTDDLGQYRVFGLAPGKYYVRVSHAGAMRPDVQVTASPSEGYASVYYPNTPDVSRALALDLRPGEERRGTDFTLLPTRVYRVSGRVLQAETGQPPENAMILLFTRDTGWGTGPVSQSVSRAMGRGGSFELRNVPPGSYVVMAQSMSRGGGPVGQMSGTAEVAVTGGNVTNLEIVLHKPVDAGGQVRVENSPANLDLTSIRLAARPDDMMFRGGANAVVEADGKLKMERLSAGRFRLMLISAGDPPLYIKSARAGETDVLEHGLTVRPGVPPPPIDVVLSAAGGTIQATLMDDAGQPVTSGYAVLLPEPRYRQREDYIRAATPDQYGRVTLRGLRPGDYKLFGFTGIESGQWMDPDFVARFEDRGKSIRVQDASNEMLELRVLNADGSPVR